MTKQRKSASGIASSTEHSGYFPRAAEGHLSRRMGLWQGGNVESKLEPYKE